MIRLQTPGGRKSRMLFTLLLFMSFSSCFGQERGYAVFDSSTGTLTFKYGTPTGTLNTDYYNTDNIGAGYPGWYGITTSIKKVVFDSSFANARPNSCHLWFANCTNLTVIDGIEYLNTSDVTNMSDMFYKCSGLTSLDVTHFNTEKVTTMQLMFWGCSGLTSLDVTHFNTANVTHMGSMFQTCRSLTSLDVSNFNTEKVTDMRWMFTGCSGLISLDLSKFNTEEVTNMECMFDGCSGLTSLDVSHFNTAKVTTMEAMFKGCSGLTSLVVSNFNTENVTNMYEMFSGCSRLTNLDVTHFNTSNVTSMGYMFYNCSSLTNLDVSNFNTAKVTDMGQMFSNCSGLNSLDVSHFNTANVKSMSSMFSGCSGLTSLDLSNFNTANVTYMNSMFHNCSGLTSLDLSNFNTANVTNMYGMFSLCSGLTSLDVSNFNTAKVTDMGYMFSNCSGLTSVTFGENFTTASCTNFSNMFKSCGKMRYLDFYASNDDNTHAFKEANLNRNGASSTVLFGKEGPGLPLTTVIYMPHDISKSDYTNYTDLPNLVFNDGGTLKAANYYSEDKVDIEFPREFKTTKAEYSRTMNAATQYGTVILPYEFTTNESVQAYLLRAEHTGTMWYEEVESVPAHTPFFYSKKTASDTNVNFNKTVANYGITVAATHTTSNAEGGQPYDAASGMDGWTTKGYYITETVDASSGNTYYISGDKFWRATGTLKMYPHRVTYQGQWQYDPDATEAPAMLNVITMGASETGDDLPSEVSTAIEAAHLRSLQQNARDIYDAQGRRQSELKSGLNIVRMADGTTVKIVKR